jgi:hypothetical protein
MTDERTPDDAHAVAQRLLADWQRLLDQRDEAKAAYLAGLAARAPKQALQGVLEMCTAPPEEVLDWDWDTAGKVERFGQQHPDVREMLAPTVLRIWDDEGRKRVWRRLRADDVAYSGGAHLLSKLTRYDRVIADYATAHQADSPGEVLAILATRCSREVKVWNAPRIDHVLGMFALGDLASYKDLPRRLRPGSGGSTHSGGASTSCG